MKRFELTAGESFKVGDIEVNVTKCGLNTIGGGDPVPVVTIEFDDEESEDDDDDDDVTDEE